MLKPFSVGIYGVQTAVWEESAGGHFRGAFFSEEPAAIASMKRAPPEPGGKGKKA
jgi:hypothetical protein